MIKEQGASVKMYEPLNQDIMGPYSNDKQALYSLVI